MATSLTEEIKFHLLRHLSENTATWGNVCGEVAAKVQVSQQYVERALGELVRAGKVQQQHSSRGFPTYKAMSGPAASPGAIEGKYRPVGERRLELEKSGTFEDNPMFEPITTHKAV